MKIPGVYMIENLVNGKLYVGSSVDCIKRGRTHFKSLNEGTHHSIKLQRAWNLYGWESFVFQPIECVLDPLELNSREQFWIDHYNAATDGYNICSYALSSRGVKRSLEVRAKLSEAQKQRWTAEQKEALAEKMRGRVASKETREKQSLAAKGKKKSAEHVEAMRSFWTEEARAKASLTLTGRKMPEKYVAEMRERMRTPEAREFYSSLKRGVKKSPEHVAKMSASQKGKVWTPEMRARMVEINNSEDMKKKRSRPWSEEAKAKAAATRASPESQARKALLWTPEYRAKATAVMNAARLSKK